MRAPKAVGHPVQDSLEPIRTTRIVRARPGAAAAGEYRAGEGRAVDVRNRFAPAPAVYRIAAVESPRPISRHPVDEEHLAQGGRAEFAAAFRVEPATGRDTMPPPAAGRPRTDGHIPAQGADPVEPAHNRLPGPDLAVPVAARTAEDSHSGLAAPRPAPADNPVAPVAADTPAVAHTRVGPALADTLAVGAPVGILAGPAADSPAARPDSHRRPAVADTGPAVSLPARAGTGSLPGGRIAGS